MCVIFDCGHHHLESCLSTSPLTCDLAGLSKSKHGGFFSCLLVLFFFFGVLLCILYCGVCFLFFLEKVICVDQRTIRTIRSNSKPQILKAHSRLYPFSFLATVVSDENEF